MFATFAHICTWVVILDYRVLATQSTIWNIVGMPYFREILMSFFRIRGYNKLNKLTDGNIVFADVYSWVPAQHSKYRDLNYTADIDHNWVVVGAEHGLLMRWEVVS
jgi:hypothetical protein